MSTTNSIITLLVHFLAYGHKNAVGCCPKCIVQYKHSTAVQEVLLLKVVLLLCTRITVWTSSSSGAVEIAVERKIRTRLDLLNIPQSGGGKCQNV